VHSPVANSSVHFSPVLNSSLNSSQVQTPVINVSGQSSPPFVRKPISRSRWFCCRAELMLLSTTKICCFSDQLVPYWKCHWNCLVPGIGKVVQMSTICRTQRFYPQWKVNIYRENGTLTIMWTSIALFTGGIWTPNHFVPLLNNHPSHSSPVTSTNKNIPINIYFSRSLNFYRFWK
jgi:hypothetical protein